MTVRAHSAAAAGAASRRRWAGLFFIALGVAMIIVDATIVNVAVPQIIKDLGISSSDAQWVQEVYTLVFAALLLVWGRLGDRYGRRLLFVTGATSFAAASVLAAFSQSGPELIGSRVLQGIAGAMMLPASLSLLNAGFRGRDRAIAFAVWGSTIGGTAALGPLLGGWLTTSYSWRWAFGINVPIGLAVTAGTLLLVPESKDAAAAHGNDLAGALLSVLGFGGIIFGLIEGRSYGWWTRTGHVSIAGLGWTWPISPVPVAFAAGVICLLGFVAVERRRNAAGRVVLLDLGLFSIPSFRNGNIAAGIVSLGEFGLLFSLPLWFENVRGYSAFATGIALLPLAIGSFAASGFGAQLARRKGPVFTVRLGIALELVGVAGLGVVIGPDHGMVGDGTCPVHLRARRRARDGAAHRGGTRRHTGSEQRPGFGYAKHQPPDRLRVRHRDPGHRAVQHAGRSAHAQAGRRPGDTGRTARRDRDRRQAERRCGDQPAGRRSPHGTSRGTGETGVLRGDPADRILRGNLPRPRAAGQPVPGPRRYLRPYPPGLGGRIQSGVAAAPAALPPAAPDRARTRVQVGVGAVPAVRAGHGLRRAGIGMAPRRPAQNIAIRHGNLLVATGSHGGNHQRP